MVTRFVAHVGGQSDDVLACKHCPVYTSERTAKHYQLISTTACYHDLLDGMVSSGECRHNASCGDACVPPWIEHSETKHPKDKRRRKMLVTLRPWDALHYGALPLSRTMIGILRKTGTACAWGATRYHRFCNRDEAGGREVCERSRHAPSPTYGASRLNGCVLQAAERRSLVRYRPMERE